MFKKFNSKILSLLLLSFILSSCSTTYTHNSGNNSNFNYDSRSCSNLSKLYAPTYLCKNPFYCQPDEYSLVIDSLARNNAYYDQCMLQKGYRAQ